jgi:ABC-2 type transport system permease protein
MSANVELQRVNEWRGLRGFRNLLGKESQAWWGTRRWWVNALVWLVVLCGLTVNMLFVPTVANMASEAEIAAAGGLTAYILLMGLNVFFKFGTVAVGIGTIILTQDAIISEKQSGMAEWLLSKPISRRSYVLAKLAANAIPVLVLLIGIPAATAYTLLSLRQGGFFPWTPFLSGVGLMTIHTLFYLTLTLLLGAIFNNRGPILGIALASALGGSLVGGLFQPALYVTPWILPDVAVAVAAGQAVPDGLGSAPLVVTLVWTLVFILVSLFKFERTEF